VVLREILEILGGMLCGFGWEFGDFRWDVMWFWVEVWVVLVVFLWK